MTEETQTDEQARGSTATACSPRLFYGDPDFRRQPKTKRFCYHCQKDLTCLAKHFILVCDDGSLHVVDPEDANRVPHQQCEIGPECAKYYPREFVVSE